MQINSFEGVQPVRFPSDYPMSIPPSSGAPAVDYDHVMPSLQQQPANANVTTNAQNMGGSLSISSQIGPVGRLSLVSTNSVVDISLGSVGAQAAEVAVREEVDIDDGMERRNIRFRQRQRQRK